MFGGIWKMSSYLRYTLVNMNKRFADGFNEGFKKEKIIKIL